MRRHDVSTHRPAKVGRTATRGVPPGIDPGQLDATFPHDDLDQLLGDQHQERGPMLRGLWHGVLVGAAVGLVAGIAVGALLVTMSFGSLSSFATVFMTGAIGVAIGATAGAVYEAPRSEEIADEREVIRRRS